VRMRLGVHLGPVYLFSGKSKRRERNELRRLAPQAPRQNNLKMGWEQGRAKHARQHVNIREQYKVTGYDGELIHMKKMDSSKDEVAIARNTIQGAILEGRTVLVATNDGDYLVSAQWPSRAREAFAV
jgi:septum formation inhibitor-activating ATPase MinD